MFDDTVIQMKCVDDTAFTWSVCGEQRRLKPLKASKPYMVKAFGTFGMVWAADGKYMGEYNMDRFSGAKEAR